MATVQQHLDQWKHNREFAKTIDRKYTDWQVNVIFYAALHFVDAALSKLNVKVTDHSSRIEEIKSNASFSTVRNQYMNLYRISRITRYDADPDLWIPKEFLDVTDLVEKLLKPIENGIGPLISKEYKPLILDK